MCSSSLPLPLTLPPLHLALSMTRAYDPTARAGEQCRISSEVILTSEDLVQVSEEETQMGSGNNQIK